MFDVEYFAQSHAVLIFAHGSGDHLEANFLHRLA